MKSSVIVKQYVPRGAALEVFKRREPEVLLAGPAGTGKSRAALEKLHAMCIANANMRALMVRKTHVSLTNTGLVTFQEHVAQDDLEAGVLRWYGGSASRPPAFIYDNGSTINVGGMDKPMKVMSSEYDVAYVQEATELTLEDWEMLSSRLRNGRVSFQQIIADCNPDSPTHWLKKRCDEGSTTLLHSLHEDNPVLFNLDGTMTDKGKAYMTRLDALTGVRKQRLRYGKWVAAEGIIYEDFDQQVHVIDPFDIPEDWERVWTVDFGYTNPSVLQCWALDHDGRGYLYREFYRTQQTVVELAAKVLSVVAPDGTWIEPKPVRIVCDHDAGERAQLHTALNIPNKAAIKDVKPGIEAVMQRMLIQGDGKPRLYLVRNSLVERDESLVSVGRPTCTIEEIAGYVWDNTPGKVPKEAPVKENDHGMDAMRYFVADQDMRRHIARFTSGKRP